jgi:hypothetical protein
MEEVQQAMQEATSVNGELNCKRFQTFLQAKLTDKKHLSEEDDSAYIMVAMRGKIVTNESHVRPLQTTRGVGLLKYTSASQRRQMLVERAQALKDCDRQLVPLLLDVLSSIRASVLALPDSTLLLSVLFDEPKKAVKAGKTTYYHKSSAAEADSICQAVGYSTI